MAVVGRFLQPPAGSFFLFGPRGTGKSTWLQQRFPEALRIDLLAPDVLRAYQARPERLRERIDAEPGATTVVVDEVQKAPQLLDVVHSLVEERPELRFVLTGSSVRKLRHGAANLLGGRLVAAHMLPFMAAELGDGFHLERALQIGLVPLVWEAADHKATLVAYASDAPLDTDALARRLANGESGWGVLDDAGVRRWIGAADVLTDAFAPVDQLLTPYGSRTTTGPAGD